MNNKLSTFKKISPAILYIGTPVALITTVDEHGNDNIGPMSSVWALDQYLVLGLREASRTFQNLIQQKQCVINFPYYSLFEQVENIADLTGLNPVPEYKKDRYRYSADKFEAGNFSRLPSMEVVPPRIAECPIQMEAVLKDVLYLPDNSANYMKAAALCVEVLCVYAQEAFIIEKNHIDPSKWNPLIYNFRHYFGLGKELGKTFRAEY
jgi:flavin reductase (DIM6/NTAB) family NADH-FMN oxidoreductase RutF